MADPSRPKLTRTTRYLASKSPRCGFDAVRRISPDVLGDPTFIPRLSWNSTQTKVNYDPAQLASTVSDASDVSFFCDTSVFDDSTDPAMWPALVNAPKKLALTPRVVQE